VDAEKAAMEESTTTDEKSVEASPPRPRHKMRKTVTFEDVAHRRALNDIGGDESEKTSVVSRSLQAEEDALRFSFYSKRLSSNINARCLHELVPDGQSFASLFQGAKDPKLPRTTYDAGHSWWLDVTAPTDEEMKVLSQVFSLLPLTTEDIQIEEEREKIDTFRNYYFISFRSFEQDPNSPMYLEPLNVYIVVFDEGVLSLRSRPSPHARNVERRIKQLGDAIDVTSDWICYALIDDITDAFAPLLLRIEDEVDAMDDEVLLGNDDNQGGSELLGRIGRCRRKIVGLLALLSPKGPVVKGLEKRCLEMWGYRPKSDITSYLSDIQDHLVTMTSNLNHYEAILSRTHSTYLLQTSMGTSGSNNRTAEALAIFSIIGAAVVPLNVIASLLGTNIAFPGKDPDATGNYDPFIGVMCFIVGYSVICWLLGRMYLLRLKR